MADIKFKLDVPTGCTYLMTNDGRIRGATSDEGMTVQTTTESRGGAGADRAMLIWAVVTTAAASGNVTLHWAQNTSEASDTKLLTGSLVIATKVE